MFRGVKSVKCVGLAEMAYCMSTCNWNRSNTTIATFLTLLPFTSLSYNTLSEERLAIK